MNKDLNSFQSQIVTTKNSHVVVASAAASGKSMVIVERLRYLLEQGVDPFKIVAITFTNNAASVMYERLGRPQGLFIGTVHSYCNYLLRGGAVDTTQIIKEERFDDLFEEIKQNPDCLKQVEHLLVDEVQDYTTEWLRIVMQTFLLPNGEFVVFGDPKQNVYHRPIDSNGDIRLGVIGGVWNKELSTGRRFTNPRLASLATAFQARFLSKQPVDTINAASDFDNSLNFQIVTYYNMRGEFTMDNLVLKLTEIIKNSNNSPKDFVVLASYSKLLQTIDFKYREKTGEKTEITFVSTEQFEHLKQLHNVTDKQPANWKFNRDYEALGRTRKQLFTTDKRCLKLSTIKSFKGWESPCVIIILDDEYNAKAACNMPMEPEMMYTAITRARENLYIINIGNETYDKFFKEQTI